MIVPSLIVPGSTWHITAIFGDISASASDPLMPDRDLSLGAKSEPSKRSWGCKLVSSTLGVQGGTAQSERAILGGADCDVGGR